MGGWIDFLVSPILLDSLMQLQCTEQLVKLSKYYEIIWKQSVSAKLVSQSFRNATLILNHIFRKKQNRHLPDTYHFTYILSFFLIFIKMLGGWNWSHFTGLGNCEMKNLITRLQLVSSKDLFAPKHLLSHWIMVPHQGSLHCNTQSCHKSEICHLVQENTPLLKIHSIHYSCLWGSISVESWWELWITPSSPVCTSSLFSL